MDENNYGYQKFIDHDLILLIYKLSDLVILKTRDRFTKLSYSVTFPLFLTILLILNLSSLILFIKSFHISADGTSLLS